MTPDAFRLLLRAESLQVWSVTSPDGRECRIMVREGGTMHCQSHSYMSGNCYGKARLARHLQLQPPPQAA